MKSSIIRLALIIVIVILGYFVFTSIKEPLKFEKELRSRNKEVIAKLADIRTSELLFKKFNNRYTRSFDTLIEFMENCKIPVIKLVADTTDAAFSKPMGDTIGFISLSDSIFGEKYKLENIAIVPFSLGAKFLLNAGRIDKDGISIAVFEASTPYVVYLKGLDKRRIISLVQELNAKNKFPGLKVGSLNEATTAGNWE